ncbi:MAG TPA: aminotransferase class I/II-fold pyridoxal phosphate-dependent enzyme [Bacillota bacterium]|nr:aminotransferase class I/II-fold pyridoxal phosphate-dependent enzyme [Bacillota bacterium]
MNREPVKTPLWDAVRRHVDSATYPYHVPGHKQGRGLVQAFARDLAQYDLTELPGLDNLLDPSGPLAEAETMAARLSGAAACHFTTGGSTSGIIAALLALCPAGKQPLLPRNAHVSCVHACVLADLVPMFYDVTVDAARQVYLAADTADFTRMLSPQVGVALLVSPNYHGVISDVSTMAALSHEAGIPLVVDEAHGTHLLMSPPLPASAVFLGADVVVQSVHKTGVALTGAAWVNVNNEAYIRPVKAALRLIQSTSPSYLQLVSLDLARAYLEEEGRQRVGAALDAAQAMRSVIPVYQPPNVPYLDPLRVVIDALAFGMSGHQLGQYLARRGVTVEMTDLTTAVLVLSPGDDHKAVAPVTEAISALWKDAQGPVSQHSMRRLYASDQFAMTPRTAYLGPGEEVELGLATGRIAAEPVTIYPPGSPLIWPGQRIDEDFIEYINMSLAQGASVTGVSCGLVRVVK